MADPIASMSEGQKNCLRLVGRGMSSKEIAKATGLTPQTVHTYVKEIYRRSGVRSRAQLLAKWLGGPRGRG